MHTAVMTYFSSLKKNHPDLFVERKVLEVGSRNINGSIRDLFSECEYIGIDQEGGNGVDVVSLIHEYEDKPNGYFDIIVSTSSFEHDPYWNESVKRCIELVREGGTIAFHWAGPGTKEHFSPTPGDKYYYENRSVYEIRDIMEEWAAWREIWYLNQSRGATNLDCFLLCRGKNELGRFGI